MLYQEMRPESWEQVVGNEALVRSLEALMEGETRPHAYLFGGPSGCGKTTLARILATSLGCEGIDLMEINAASARGIDQIRELDKRSRFKPMKPGGARVILFDEAHQLTSQAQQSLLKMMEDIPEYQYYILSTTDPAKVVATIRNRCAAYTVRKLRTDDMLELVGAAEEYLEMELEEEVKAMIVLAAEGCARQALMLVEQVVGMEEEAAIRVVESTSPYQREIIDLCRELGKGMGKRDDVRTARVIKIMASLDDDAERIKRALLGYLGSRMLRAKSVAVAEKAARWIEAIAGVNAMMNGSQALFARIIRQLSSDNFPSHF